LAGEVDERGGSLCDERRCHMMLPNLKALDDFAGMKIMFSSVSSEEIYIDRMINRERIFSSILP
jgi:hypothetical protein